jgi:hypothetical protein
LQRCYTNTGGVGCQYAMQFGQLLFYHWNYARKRRFLTFWLRFGSAFYRVDRLGGKTKNRPETAELCPFSA